MRRSMFGVMLMLGTACCVFAQEGGSAAEPSDPWLGWKWANFAILAAGLGYLIYKHVPALFAQRSAEIQKGILEATQAHKEAEGRAAVIERRLAGLEKEVEGLRVTARAEIAAEGERIKAETERRLRSIQDQSAQEIALMSRGIRDELRNYSTGLALDLAQERIRARMTKVTEDRLVDEFLQDLRYRLRPGDRN